MGNTWALSQDTRWHHIRDYTAPEHRVQLAKDIERASDPQEMVGVVYLTLVTAYKDGHLEGVQGEREAA